MKHGKLATQIQNQIDVESKRLLQEIAAIHTNEDLSVCTSLQAYLYKIYLQRRYMFMVNRIARGFLPYEVLKEGMRVATKDVLEGTALALHSTALGVACGALHYSAITLFIASWKDHLVPLLKETAETRYECESNMCSEASVIGAQLIRLPEEKGQERGKLICTNCARQLAFREAYISELIICR